MKTIKTDSTGSLKRMVGPRGRPRKPSAMVEWGEIPGGIVNMAQRRTKDMLDHYGRNITSMPIETLVASCYLQGVEDAMNYAIKH